MKQNARMAVQSRNFILYILIVLTVFMGPLAQETRAQSEFMTAAESAQASVYRLIPGMPLTDEPCTGKMIGTQTKLPAIRAFRPFRRAFRALLVLSYVCAAVQTVHPGTLLRHDAYQAQVCGQGLVTTIQYIHDLDGKKSA